MVLENGCLVVSKSERYTFAFFWIANRSGVVVEQKVIFVEDACILSNGVEFSSKS